MAQNTDLSLNLWLDDEDELFEYSAQSPAPSKNFNQIIVSPSQVNS